MAGFNYAKSQNTADRLIKKFGQVGAIMKYVAPVDTRSKPTYTPQPCSLVVLDYSNSLIDGTRITAKDRQIYVSVKGIGNIAEEDRIRDAAGQVYEIMPPIKQLNPGGINVYWEIQGRI